MHDLTSTTTVAGATAPQPAAADAAGFQPPGDLAPRYARDGFVLVEGVLTGAECATLDAEAKRILRERGGPGASIQVDASLGSAICRGLADDDRLLAILGALMPDGIMFLSDRIAAKSASARFGTPWHSDTRYWPGTRPKISLWIALDDVAPDDGALVVVRGSHLQDWASRHVVTPGVNVGEFPFELAPGQWPAEREVTCAVRRGDVIVFDDRLIHGTRPNRSGRDRYAIISVYHAPGADEPFDLDWPMRHVCRLPAPR
jgi:phytanoyl-CoA hydroxylase